jgi:5-methylcytosine-specific restriction endonuclease McrA
LQNNERTREYDVARRAERPRSIYSFEDKIKLWARQSGICFCCAIAIDEGDIPLAQIDHATPLARGGVDEYRNLALAHSACNQQKHNKTLLEHWQYRFNSGKDAVKLDNAAIKAAIARARSKS